MERVFCGSLVQGLSSNTGVSLFCTTLVQKHVYADVMKCPHWGPIYVSREYEQPQTSFAVHERDVREQAAYLDKPFMEELKSLDMITSVRAAPLDFTGVAVAVRGDNVPWDCGEHPMLGRGQNSPDDHFHEVRMPSEVSPPPSSPPTDYQMPELVSRQQIKSTPEVARDVFTNISKRAHATVFGGKAS